MIQRRGLGFLAMLGALVIALAGCGAMAPPLIGTPAPTLPVPPAQALSWQAESLPPNVFSNGPYVASLVAVADAESATAYVCVQGKQPGSAQIDITHDAAHTWAPVGTIEFGAPITNCGLVIDQLVPNTLVAELYSRANVNCAACFPGIYHNFVSFDGGGTWARISGPDVLLNALATFHGVTYAIFAPQPVDLAQLKTEFVASRDGMRTWAHVDGDITSESGRFATDFWVNPASGTVLAQTSTDWVNSTRFYYSENDGQSWDAIPTPGADEFFVQVPFANTPWTICGLYSSWSNMYTPPPTAFICTSDGGATWIHRGAAYGEFGPSPAMMPDDNLFAIADDGSLLMDYDELSRLAPGTTAPESLGLLPTTGSPTQFLYAPGNGEGRIWALPQDANLPNVLANTATIYTAPYI